MCVLALLFGASVQAETGLVTIIAAQGTVKSSMDGKIWVPAGEGDRLAEGVRLQTASGACVDLVLDYNGSVFRLVGDSELLVGQLRKTDTGVDMVTETKLSVMRGSLVGAQRKLHHPSVLAIATPNGEAIIRGTEYVVSQQGAVTVLSGSVDVNYNLPGNKGSVKVTVTAGNTFSPATGTVVPTTPGYLESIIADVNTVRRNAEVFKAGGATIVVKPNSEISPSTPKGNNGVGNGLDPQPPGNPPINDGPGTSPGNPGNKGGKK